jgi:hypothetical protein
MKTTVKSIAFAIALAAGTSGFAAGPSDVSSPNIKELTRQTKALEFRAERPQEHRALAADYRQLAQLQRDESMKLDERAAWYAQFPIYSSEKYKRSTIGTSLYFARKYRTDAQKSENLAARHERLAG